MKMSDLKQNESQWKSIYVFGGVAAILSLIAVVADIVKHSWRSFTSSFWEVICNYDANRDADALGDLPVLCIHGDQDETAPLTGALVLAAGRPGWQVHILNGVDHQPWLRAPEICQKYVDNDYVPKILMQEWKALQQDKFIAA